MDVPPFVIAAREPVAYCGLNIVGLRRRNFSAETINDIHNAYRIIYNSNLRLSDALEQIRETVTIGPEVQYIIDFVAASRRGIIR